MGKNKLPITCPLCGRKSEYPVEALVEGAQWKCSFCPTSLTLHGHMWEDIRAEIAKAMEEVEE
jgi:rubrerythrin